MSTNDALATTSALDALTRYYYAKEREESAVLYIEDSYHEAVNSLENLEADNAELCKQVDDLMHEYERLGAENAKLRELVLDIYEAYEGEVNDCWLVEFRERMRELGIEAEKCVTRY